MPPVLRWRRYVFEDPQQENVAPPPGAVLLKQRQQHAPARAIRRMTDSGC